MSVQYSASASVASAAGFKLRSCSLRRSRERRPVRVRFRLHGDPQRPDSAASSSCLVRCRQPDYGQLLSAYSLLPHKGWLSWRFRRLYGSRYSSASTTSSSELSRRE
ncbi:hypothetical protein ATANTOWER_022032 [Ataeniobius toweri]|uniref:Uncharacterized protein n=1 Tax=Ataeniobius toweri TaxID=208326 RepID=A0ABU7CC75_9TELE|nr:hypothetical protein [Ataeniobius toweri]